MHPNAALIQRFYEAFQKRDAETMAACYHDDVVFSDPAFGELRGERARNMWRMLTARATDLGIEASEIRADDREGSARWVATYAFGKAKRPVRIDDRSRREDGSATPPQRKGRSVRNEIRARFEFRDGKIVRHADTFSLWRWARQALGPTGALLGWTPMVRGRVRSEALRGLDAFEAKRK